MIKFYTTSSNISCRKALSWMKENQIEYQKIKIERRYGTTKKTGFISRDAILEILSYSENGFDDIISMRCTNMKRMVNSLHKKFEDMKFNEVIDYILNEDGNIIRFPLVVDTDRKAIISGFDVNDYGMLLSKEKRRHKLNKVLENSR